MYLTLEEYVNYGGKEDLSESDFTLYEFRARKRIDYWTDCRVQRMREVPEAVKLCMMSIIDYDRKYGAKAQADNPVVASFNTDGYSESYGSVTEQAQSALGDLYRSIKALLYGEYDDNGTMLLYRGVYE